MNLGCHLSLIIIIMFIMKLFFSDNLKVKIRSWVLGLDLLTSCCPCSLFPSWRSPGRGFRGCLGTVGLDWTGLDSVRADWKDSLSTNTSRPVHCSFFSGLPQGVPCPYCSCCKHRGKRKSVLLQLFSAVAGYCTLMSLH